MSAFIVSDQLLHELLSFASHHKMRFDGDSIREHESEVGQKILDVNYQSVNFRYKEKDAPHVYKFKKVPAISCIQFISHVRCIIYQSCEHEGFNRLPLIELAYDATSLLPEYNTTKWGG